MAERYLIDTSAVIKYLNGSFPEMGLKLMDQLIDEESLLSFITEIELQVWNPANPDDLHVYEQFVGSSFVFGIDQPVIAETIRIRKDHHIKLPDALIAATAIVHDLTLVADNDKDYTKVLHLKYINPNNLKETV
jgi:hypothetical protein